jgi:predicted amidohydrolase
MSAEAGRLRIALWQCEQQPGDVAGNLARLHETARHAAQQGAQLLVCPEMFLTGYNIGAESAARLAEPADGPSAQAVAAIASECGLAIVWGFAERSAEGAVFNAVQVADAQGRRCGLYRKTHLFGALDRAMFSQSDGASALFELHGWQIGLLICYDLEFPEAARRLALAGAKLVVAPTANMAGFDVVPLTLVPARAYENQVFVAYANCCGQERGLLYGGLSAVASPGGAWLAQAGRDAALLLADLDGADAGFMLNTYLADRRPETYGALVAEAAAPRPPIASLPDSSNPAK